MSRSGYSYDYDHLELYRANMARVIRSKRGQEFLREMAAALDAMPVKALCTSELESPTGEVCALGAVGKARGIDMSTVDPEDPDAVAALFGIPRMLAAEIAFENEETVNDRTDAIRWRRMREWVTENLERQP